MLARGAIRDRFRLGGNGRPAGPTVLLDPLSQTSVLPKGEGRLLLSDGKPGGVVRQSYRSELVIGCSPTCLLGLILCSTRCTDVHAPIRLMTSSHG